MALPTDPVSIVTVFECISQDHDSPPPYSFPVEFSPDITFAALEDVLLREAAQLNPLPLGKAYWLKEIQVDWRGGTVMNSIVFREVDEGLEVPPNDSRLATVLRAMERRGWKDTFYVYYWTVPASLGSRRDESMIAA